MIDLIKRLGIWLLVILIILILGIAILLLRCFVFDKIDFGFGKNSKKNKHQSINSSNISNGVSSFASDVYDGYKNANVTDNDYNSFNFDDAILMYEGEQKVDGVIVVVDKLIADADYKLFSKPSVELENFGIENNLITYTTREEYKNSLNNIKNNILEEGDYTISFGYTPLHASVNKIIITRK